MNHRGGRARGWRRSRDPRAHPTSRAPSPTHARPRRGRLRLASAARALVCAPGTPPPDRLVTRTLLLTPPAVTTKNRETAFRSHRTPACGRGVVALRHTGVARENASNRTPGEGAGLTVERARLSPSPGRRPAGRGRRTACPRGVHRCRVSPRRRRLVPRDATARCGRTAAVAEAAATAIGTDPASEEADEEA